MADANTECPTTLGADCVIKGQLHFKKGVRLLGKFEGEIVGGEQIVVGEGATLNGDAKAGTIRIDGRVKGNLHADVKVHLTSSARLEGDLQAARLEVAEGAVLIGRCVIGVNTQGKMAGDVKTAPAETVAVSKSKGGQTAPATARG